MYVLGVVVRTKAHSLHSLPSTHPFLFSSTLLSQEKARITPPARSPSPYTVMNDVELYTLGLGRARTASPGPQRVRTIKYIGRRDSTGSRGSSPRGSSGSPAMLAAAAAAPLVTSGAPPSPPPPRNVGPVSNHYVNVGPICRNGGGEEEEEMELAPARGRTEAEQKLQREVDFLEQELADINRVEHNISNIVFVSPSFDGHKPGDVKQILLARTPSFKQDDLKSLNRFHSPQQSRFEAHPPAAAAKPVSKPMIQFESAKRGNDNFEVVARASSSELTKQKRSAFFLPTRFGPGKDGLE
jgi:hypothetical protein